MHLAAVSVSLIPLARDALPRRHSTAKPHAAASAKKHDAFYSFPDLIEMWTPDVFRRVGAGLALGSVALGVMGSPAAGACAAAVTAAYWKVGLSDMAQTSHTLRRNFPVLAWVRYVLESIRPEIRQYLIESDTEGAPFDRAARSVVYQRAKDEPDLLPFGTRQDVYADKYEFAAHSMWPVTASAEASRVLIGGPQCTQPYSASLLNVSGMSYGALSENAVLALSRAAKMGNFYHNTGEGGMSRFHLEGGGDLVWNIGTGYFGWYVRA